MENINVKDSRIWTLVALYDMQTDYFKRALAGITDDAAQSRLDTKANHIAWIAGSLVEQRYELARMYGGMDKQQIHHELFGHYQGIKDGVQYPPLEDFKTDWDRISPVLREIMLNLDSSKLNDSFEMEDMKMTYLDMLTFSTYREASFIGQIALWRRLLDYDPLKYD